MRFRIAFLALAVGVVGGCSSSNNKNSGDDMPDAPTDDGSCFDGRQDGNETGVDCGGRCDMQCVTAGCGNGIVEAGEQCDDHNTMDGDGCDSNCTITGCGNGVITGAEICDDGNTADGDGCAADCSAKETGFDCTAGTTGQPATVCTPHCGDGMIVGTETCDDMNTDPTDGCDACQLSAGCGTGETQVILRNGTQMPIPDDDTVTGVSSTVTSTTMGAMTKVAVLVNVTHTFDGDVELHLEGPSGVSRLLTTDNGSDNANYTGTRFDDAAATSIDDGIPPYTGSFKPDESLGVFAGTKAAGTWTLHAYDDSSSDTGTLDNWTLIACANTTAGYCGDGHMDAGEECDDGNSDNTDACKNNCKLPCGDGVLDTGEACDDGNHTSGDGCSATCQLDCPTGSTLVTGSSTTAFPIPDGAPVGISSPIALTTTGAVKMVRVTVDSLTHTYDADVDMYLVGPNGASRELSTDNGSSNDNYTMTQFIDHAPTSITAGAAPFTGTFAPEQSLATTSGTDFLDSAAKGTWNLHVIDDGTGDTGTLNGWTIAVCVDTTAAYCGDGTVEAGEECDDGNTNNNDTCKNNCKLRCGDGIVDSGESCDDGNHTNGDGCSSTCQYDCPTGSTLVTKSNATAVAITDTDDGSGVDSIVNLTNSGGVSKLWVKVDSITFADTFEIDVSLIAPSGTERLLSHENGFDPNFTNTIYDDAATTSIADSDTNPFTGTFRPLESISSSAVFDNKTHQAKGNWKLHVVNVDNIYTGSIDKWTLSACVVTSGAYCGNGVKDPGEDCDDGNTTDTDACANSCLLPCGNGVVDAGEQCDDGNHTSNDGCSSTCQFDCPTGTTLATATSTTAVTIPDNNPTGGSSPVTLTGTGTAKLVRATVNITHAYDSDLVLTLSGPGASPVTRTLASNDVHGANFTSTTFADGGQPFSSGTAPFTSTFKPDQSLSTTAGTDFAGITAAGTWTLKGVDNATLDAGTINGWTLNVCVGP